MEPASPSRAAEIVPILRQRDGEETIVTLTGGRVLTVFNIAWGIDEGEYYEHLTTNVSPRVEGVDADFFVTNEVRSVIVPETGQLVWSRS